jgi:uroporphyrin-III C-methyltransferase
MQKGKVYLVGAGPGHPDLLTIKAYRLIGEADVIVYDRLIQEACLAHARKDCEKIYAGKAPSCHQSRQSEINEILARKALEGKMVVRLKGGDCLLFSRGGEEAESLAKRGIPFEFVPGVTSALAAPSAFGIPVTHRDISASFCVISGHQKEGTTMKPLDYDFSALAKIDTLVVLMGVKNLKRISDALMSHGKPKGTPVALIQQAFWPDEKAIFSTLEKVASDAMEKGIEPPACLVIGDVVGEGIRLQQEARDLAMVDGERLGKRGGRRVGKVPGSSMLYPLHLSLEGVLCVVVGGGRVAQRRVKRLLLAGARLRVVSSDAVPSLHVLAKEGKIQWMKKPFEADDLEGATLAFACTDDRETNLKCAFEARKRGILVNCADDPIACDFTLPACVIRGPLVISVSTSARSPGLAKAIRRRLEEQFGQEWGELCNLLMELRPEITNLGIPPEEITKRIEEVLGSDCLLLLKQGLRAEAKRLVREKLGI